MNASSPIAIVGVAALFPGSLEKGGFWRDILAGRDLMTDVPPSHWLIDDYYDPDPRARDKTYAKRGAFLPDVDFDALAWGIPPSNLKATDTAQLLGLIVAQQVLSDACQGQFKDVPRDRTSVILGVTSAQELLGSMVSRLQRPVWVKALREQGLDEKSVAEVCDRIASNYVEWQESSFPGLLGNVVAGRIANRLDLHGTNCVTDAACASSLSALAMGVSELRLGGSDLVITGGVDTMNDIFMYVCFSKTPALSPTGDCRPFSDQADGTMLGEGIGMFALRRLADAERDSNRIYAVIKGVGSSSDGRATSVYAPLPAGQVLALRRAYEQAGYGPDTVELVEAHGTGTRAGDGAEFAALRQVFEQSGRADVGWCALGSVKSQVGHTKAAAGAAGLFKATLALAHRVIPPTIKVERPDPRLDIDASPFFLNTAARPWVRGCDHPRRASVSSFGFGGSNFHVTLEEYTGSAPRALRVRSASSELVLIAGATAEAVAARCHELALRLRAGENLASMARSTQESFDPSSPWRSFVLGATSADGSAKLERAAELATAGKPGAVPGAFELTHGSSAGAVAFLFPGQGSQYLEMGAEVAMSLRAAQQAWDESRALELGPGEPYLDEVVYPKPVFDAAARAAQAARLEQTQWAQPAIGAVSLSLLAVLEELGLRPDAVAGHSFGEISALCAAGVISAVDMLRIARKRGELMAAAADGTPGAMTSVTASVDDVLPHLGAGGDVVIANYNTPRQLVLSGPTARVAELEARLARARFSTTRLPVASAFHSPIVGAACAPLRAFLATLPFRSPRVDAYNNGSARLYPADADAIRDMLARQLSEPVRFVDQIEAMYAAGVRSFVEVGPRNILTNLVGHILGKRPHRAIALNREGRPDLASLSEGLGQLSMAGVPLAYERLWSDFSTEPELPLRAKAANAGSSKICGSSYGKPYPPPRGAEVVPPHAGGTIMSNRPSDADRTAPRGAQLPAQPDSKAPPNTDAPAAPGWQRGGLEPTVQLAWLEAFQETQRQTIECHQTFQRVSAEAHAAFLRSTESSLASLTAILGGRPGPTPDGSLPFAMAAPTAWAPPSPPPSAPAQRSGPAHSSPPMPEPVVAEHSPGPTVRGAAAAPPSQQRLEEVGLSVVAACTGYPLEMLGIDMDLEGDLGVDSIKRVEIVSALRKKEPTLPEASASDLASKRTIRQLATFYVETLRGPGGEVPDPPDDTPGAHTPRGSGDSRRSAGERASRGGDRGANGKPEARSGAPSPAADPEPLGRWLVEARPAPALGLGTPGLFHPDGVVVTSDGGPIGAALVAILSQHGARATLVEQVPASAAAVIFLGGLRDVSDVAQALAVNREAFRAFRAVASRFAERGGTFVTVQDTGADFGLQGSARAWLGGAPGLAKTAAREWPGACVRALDIERGGRSASEIASSIWSELCAGDDQPEVGLGAGGRFVLEARPAALEDEAVPAVTLSADSVIVVSGGGRGVTSACVVALAERYGCRFVLLGRTALREEPESLRGLVDERELQSAVLSEAQAAGQRLTASDLKARLDALRAGRQIRQTLAAIEAAHGQARYETLDVSDAEQVRRALARVRERWGPITGLIHGAGVLADKALAQCTEAQFDLVFTTKVLGLEALLEATRRDELRFLFSFSSVVARVGNPGQAAYGLANEVLNKVAALEQRRRGDRCLVRALGFGPWQGGMVDERLRQHFGRMGVPLIPLAAGARHVCQELTRAAEASSEVVISRGYSLGARDAAARNELTRDVIVDRERYPFLDAHRIDGVPVVPVALVLEWFARCTRRGWPDLAHRVFRGVHVRSGIRLPEYDSGQSRRLRVKAQRDDSGDSPRVLLELLEADGVQRYVASFEAREENPARSSRALSSGATSAWAGRIYAPDSLFHGPAFHVIKHVEVSSNGLTASLTGAAERAWPGHWVLDPALLDGGLQLALLWARHLSGGAALPTSIGAVHIDHEGATAGPVRCSLTGRDADATSVVSDLAFTDSEGRAIAELREVVTHLLPARSSRATAGRR